MKRPAPLNQTVHSNHPVPSCESTDIRKLPGGLNDVPCFNSNSPELVLKKGILLSTFPPAGMKHPEAHLNYAFDGCFDLFSHHVARNETSEEDRTLYLGFIAGNPNNRKVRLQILSGGSYLSQPDAPFISAPELCLDNDGKIFSGPGDRVTQDLMRGKRPAFLPANIWLAPGQSKLLFCLPIPVRHLQPALNGRSTLVKFRSSGPVYLASLSRFVSPSAGTSIPSEKEWLTALNNFALATPRDETPTPLRFAGRVKYGRVAGVSRGTEWQATLSDYAASEVESTSGAAPEGSSSLLSIPSPGKSFTYPLSTVEGGTFGTGQVQSAPMIVRYHDTAYESHGNYGVTYRISIPLHNPYSGSMDVQLLFQSAIKSDEHSQQMCFYEEPPAKAFFRGTVCLSSGSEASSGTLCKNKVPKAQSSPSFHARRMRRDLCLESSLSSGCDSAAGIVHQDGYESRRLIRIDHQQIEANSTIARI